MPKRIFALFLALPLTSCVYTPHRVPAYDEKCQVFVNHWTLQEHDLGLSGCSGNGCTEFLLGVGAVSAASAIVSGSVVLIGNTIYWYEKRGGCPASTEVVVTTETTNQSQWHRVSAISREPDRTNTFPVTCELETPGILSTVQPAQLEIRWPSQVKKVAVLSTQMSTASALLKTVGSPPVQPSMEMVFVPCLRKGGLEVVSTHEFIPAASEYSPKAILDSLQAQHFDAVMRITYLGVRWFALQPTQPVPEKTYKDIDAALNALMTCLPTI